jgi:REP-associated tyrosine transposase
MPRLPRFQCAGATFHVTCRGVARGAIYRDDTDRLIFLAGLRTVVARLTWTCLAYCLMRTHYHLLVETPDEDLADGMKRLNGNYAQTFNRRHRRSGHLFGERYSSEFIQTEAHLYEAGRYIVLNPVRAGACARPEDWPWTRVADEYSDAFGGAPGFAAYVAEAA